MGETTYTTFTDEEVVARLRADDPLAFAELYSRYYSDAYRCRSWKNGTGRKDSTDTTSSIITSEGIR